MGLAAGHLNKRVTLQSRTDVDDEGGGSTIDWTDVVTVWASIAPGGGREFVAARQATPQLSHTVTIRYRQGVTAKHRIIYRSNTPDGTGAARVFSIESVSDPEERHEQLILFCAEIVGAGTAT